MLDPVIVNLSTPIKDFGREVTQVAIVREVNGGDLLAVDGMGKMASALKLIERLCVTPEHEDKHGNPHKLSWEAVKALTGRDIAAISEAMAPFVGVDLEELPSTPSTDG